MEVVTEADIFSPSQAKEFGKKLRQLLRYLGVAECDMEQGGMRLEANISVSPEPYSAEKTDPGGRMGKLSPEIPAAKRRKSGDQDQTW